MTFFFDPPERVCLHSSQLWLADWALCTHTHLLRWHRLVVFVRKYIDLLLSMDYWKNNKNLDTYIHIYVYKRSNSKDKDCRNIRCRKIAFHLFLCTNPFINCDNRLIKSLTNSHYLLLFLLIDYSLFLSSLSEIRRKKVVE